MVVSGEYESRVERGEEEECYFFIFDITPLDFLNIWTCNYFGKKKKVWKLSYIVFLLPRITNEIIIRLQFKSKVPQFQLFSEPYYSYQKKKQKHILSKEFLECLNLIVSMYYYSFWTPEQDNLKNNRAFQQSLLDI